VTSHRINSKKKTVRRTVKVRVTGAFDFRRAVGSHGWYDLPPFSWDAESCVLLRAVELPGAGPAALRVTAGLDGQGHRILIVRVTTSGDPGRIGLAGVARTVCHMLRLDEDFGSFYGTAARVDRPDLKWVEGAGAGRLLRSPTVFEDLVKMICTTNCTWALTRVMVEALVARLGRPAPEGMRTFPGPEAMARERPSFYRDVVRAGYRGPFLRDLARGVSAGAIDPEAWNDPRRGTQDIRKEILSVKGAGGYVADNMLKLLGRYDGLGIDSWCRRKFSLMYHRGRKVKDNRIERFYAPFGGFRGLALWCDITKDWFEEGGAHHAAPGKFASSSY
jgi:N-glycosylase/DNA lyase